MSSIAAEDAENSARHRQRNLALAAIIVAVAIWGLQFVMIRLAVTTTLTPFDITVLRYVFALPVMAPILWMYGWRKGAGVGWGRAAILTCVGGAPMLMLSNFGLQFAPANHASCLQPGTVAVVSTLFLLITGGARRTALTPIGLAVAVAGLALVTLGGSRVAGVGALTPLGDMLFVVSGVCWALYSILLVRWKASPLVMTALCAVLSLFTMPIFLLFMETRIASAPLSDVLMHGLFQGLVNYTVAFLLWAYAAKVLGAVRMGFSAPLIPVFGVMFAIPVLAEWPAPVQWIGVAGVVGGLLLIAWTQLKTSSRA